jgi:hypothetical protein
MKTLSRIIVGLALAAPLTIASAVRADDKTSPSDKQEVSMGQLPKPVKSTVQRETKGKNVESMTKSADSSGTVAYEIKYRDGSKETTLDVASNGKVLGRHVQDTTSTSPSNQNNPPGTQSNQINKDTQNHSKDTQSNPPSSQSTPNPINQDNENHSSNPPKNDGNSNDTKPNDTQQRP